MSIPFLLQTSSLSLNSTVALSPQQLSFSGSLAIAATPLLQSNLSLRTQPVRRKITTIRMGGGPRTYPGGVSKWQWKRMQANKAKQLLKARLARERQIYEMRKRAELKAAASELERPWDVVERAPNLFSVRADEQVKVLADRFQRPGGFDMWSDRDGPQLFRADDEVPSARFFPKGVVHSVKPYARIDGSEPLDGEEQRALPENVLNWSNGNDKAKVSGRLFKEKGGDLEKSESESESSRNVVESKGVDNQSRRLHNGKLRRKRRNGGNLARPGDSNGLNSRQVGLDRKQRRKNSLIRNSQRRIGDSDSEVYDMNLQRDGSYGLRAGSDQNAAAKEEIAKLRYRLGPLRNSHMST